MTLRTRAATLGLSLMCGASLLGAQAAKSCTGRWSAPAPITRADGRPVYIERGLVAPLGNRTIALGSPTFFWLQKDNIAPPENFTDTAAMVFSFTRSGAFVDAAGVAEGIPLVDSLRPRRAPTLAGWAPGRITVAFEGADSIRKKDGDYGDITRIELATFDGAKWTRPDTIIRGTRINIYSPLARRPGVPFQPSVFAALSSDSAGQYLHIARPASRHWTDVVTRSTSTISQVVVTPMRDGSLLELRIGYGPDGATAIQSRRATVRRDSLVWGEPVIIHHIIGAYEYFSGATLGGDSVLVVQHQQASKDQPSRLFAFLSVDAGVTWTTPDFGTVSTPMSAAQLVLDASGRVHLVHEAPRDEAVLNSPGRVWHMMLIGGKWTTPEAVSLDESVTAPGVGASPNGGLMVSWTNAVMTPQGPLPKSVARYWSQNCP